jgi:hypothetical protein
MANSLKNGRSLAMRTHNFSFMAHFSTTATHTSLMLLHTLWSFPVPTISQISPITCLQHTHLGHHFQLSHTTSHKCTLIISLNFLSSDSLASFTSYCTPILVTSLNSPVCSNYSPTHSTMSLSHCLALP